MCHCKEQQFALPNRNYQINELIVQEIVCRHVNIQSSIEDMLKCVSVCAWLVCSVLGLCHQAQCGPHLF